MKLPFHAVEVRGDILFAARGASIHTFNLTDGSHISCAWKFPAVEAKNTPAPKKEDQLVINVSENSTPGPSQDEQGPPTKRVKLDSSEAVASPDKTAETGVTTSEGKDETTPHLRGGGGGRKHRKAVSKPGYLSQPIERPMVILMTVTQDGQYVLAVTSDKSIWVLEHGGQGQLKQLSRRTMPKRPCSVVISPDNKDILAADKFGDVYSVPLIQSPNWKPSAGSADASAPAEAEAAAAASPSPTAAPSPTTDTQQDKEAATRFIPQATELTVHTGRNRKALLDQKISAKKPDRGTPRRSEAEPFERYLLLGHVSLLTAVALAFDDQKRPYVLTADRDEHIRVSRGTRELAYVIERFCLGHDDFVNRICVPSKMGNLLVSAGGDPDIFVWRWKEGQLVGKTPLLDQVQKWVPEATKVAVTGLYEWPEEDGAEGTRIVVICEKVPVLFFYNLDASGTLEFSRPIPLGLANPLDMAVVNSDKLAVAMDLGLARGGANEHWHSLIQVQRSTNGSGDYSVGTGLLKSAAMGASADLDDGEEDASETEVQKLLYSAETLRKTNFEDGADAE